ncbi:hypothetical protein [Rhodopirellula sp. P2]|uniref:hypothetical protein n=1 Tax=Rhodopirellula sp. P2 TaxID=2127060 RepID=UPI0023686080|nr:hypothetical protein [Rhodopirellula sp. P2]WDQ15441.1 hypothetical protein PSR62_17565 [Rhodopirellula sp. P2]
MPQLTSQSDVRGARNLRFCYLCGSELQSRKDRHPDHVPPKAIFAIEDRDFPLKVASCFRCNNSCSPTDEVIGQLVAVSHGQFPDDDNVAINFQQYDVNGLETPFLATIGTNIEYQIKRWTRGFHAALYAEFLPDDTPTAVHPPFPHGQRTDDGFTIKEVLDQQYLFVDLIKKNRAAGCIDQIVSNNGKMRYECVWIQMDHGPWCSVFALQLYDWVKLADTNFTRRGCTGWYHPQSGLPERATTGTNLEFAFSNEDLLDAFGP